MKICAVVFCEERHPDDKIICRAHWLLVPAAMRTEIERARHQHQARKEDRNRLDRLRALEAQAVAEVDAIVSGAIRTAT